jgi:hypothetical protein
MQPRNFTRSLLAFLALLPLVLLLDGFFLVIGKEADRA